MDTLSPDPTPSDQSSKDEPDGVPAHRAIFSTGSRVFENLRNLGSTAERFELQVYPIKLVGDGGPVRAVGV